MPDKKIQWCFKLRDGLKIVEVNERLSKSYLEHAKSSLLRAEKDINDKDLFWATITIYYAEYYALYSFLRRVGIKCGNHSCSILAAGFLLGEDKIKSISKHKNKRIDAQYYMKVDQEDKVKQMINEAKIFITEFDNLISNLSDKECETYRKKFKLLIK